MWSYNYTDELYHYGIPGMRWGHRKAATIMTKSKRARESAKEWDEMARYQQSKGTARSLKKAAKYKAYAKQDRQDAKSLANKSQKMETESKRADKFTNARNAASRSRSRGSKIATNILAGPFANRTYASVIAAGGTKNGARVVTALAGLGGGLGQLATSAYFTRKAAKGQTIKRFNS